MTPLRLTLAVLLLANAGLALSAEKAPAPRELPPAVTVESTVRKIDGHLSAFWSKNDITPAPVADDAEFFRRLSLDVIGRIPTASEARTFIDSTDPDKRAKKIDELLGRTGYSEPLRQRPPPDVGAADDRQPATPVRRPAVRGLGAHPSSRTTCRWTRWSARC